LEQREARQTVEGIDHRITQAIDMAVRASRWRITAAFEEPTTAARYMREAGTESAAATALLNEWLESPGLAGPGFHAGM
jgi:hypothetical protein